MKKVLFTLGAIALVSFGLTSCGDKDCECVAKYGDVSAVDENGNVIKFDVNDQDDCDDVTVKDLPEAYNDADGVNCSEK